MDSIKLPWIHAGYRTFALEGPAALRVEVLAREVGKSKSSFYHHFADMEVFTEALLEKHLYQARILSQREQQCHQLVPDVLNLLVEFKEDLLFNRQLRVHRQHPSFRKCVEQVNAETGAPFLAIWADAMDLPRHTHVAQVVLGLVIENFYLQITPENLNYHWLETYFREIKEVVRDLRNGQNTPSLYGGV